MISRETFLQKIKDVKAKDILSVFKLFIAIPIAFHIKKKRNNMWLVCEDGLRASDNGYEFFRFVKEKHPEQDIVYAIDNNSPELLKVKGIGQIVQTGSIEHWAFYLAAKQNISSQKCGKPNAALCYLLEIGGVLKNSRIFLQHGVTINDSKWIYYPQTKFSLFICGAKPEYDYVMSHFQYPIGKVKYLGFPRYDRLHKAQKDPNLLVIMPTWRNWLTLTSKQEKKIKVEESRYVREWNNLLNDSRLAKLLKKYNMKALFYPHRNMQGYISLFKSNCEQIVIADWEKYDIGDLIEKGSALITDYSSVFFDFVYCKKPVLFYQFDIEEYREKQLQKGYFDYEDNPFGKCAHDTDEFFEMLEDVLKSKCNVSREYEEAHRLYFPLYDDENSQRVYDAIVGLNSERQ